MKDIHAFLSGTLLCRGLSERRLAELGRACVVRNIGAGARLARRLSPVTGIFGIWRGFVKASVVSSDGRSFLGDVVGPGEWLGLGTFLRHRPRDFDLETASETTLVAIPGAHFEALLAQQPGLYRNVVTVISERYERALEQLRARTFLDAEACLALRLVRLLEVHGQLDARGGVILPFRLSQEEMGQLIGASREAVGRCLRRWERAGWIDLGYARLVVRRPEALAGLVTPRASGQRLEPHRPRAAFRAQPA